MIYRCAIYKIGAELPYGINYVPQKQIKYWVGDYSADNEKLIIEKVWVSPSRYAELMN